MTSWIASWRKIITISVGIALTLTGQALFAMSLGEAYELARQHDAQWRLAQARLRDAQELLPLAKGQLLPQISLNIAKSSVQQQLTTNSVTAPRQSYPLDSRTLSLRQSLIRLRQLRGVDRADAQIAQATQELYSEEQQLVVRVTSAYLDVLLALDRRRLIDSQLTLVSNRLAAAELGLRAGQGTRNDVDDAKAELDRIKAQSIQTNQAIQIARRQIELLTGKVPGSLDSLDLSAFRPDRLDIPSLQEAVQVALMHNPQLLAASHGELAAQHTLRQAEADHLPTLDLVAQLSKSTGENNFFAATTTSSAVVGVQLSVPIYTGGVISAQARQAATKVAQASESLQQITNKVRIDVQTQHDAVVQGRALIEALKTAVSSSAEAVKSSRKGQTAGVRTVLDVLRSESLRFQAEIDLAQARYSYVLSWVKLQTLMQPLEAETIHRITALFKPN